MDTPLRLIELDDLKSFIANLIQPAKPDDVGFTTEAVSILHALIRNSNPQIVHVYKTIDCAISVTLELPLIPADGHNQGVLMLVKARGELCASQSLSSQITYFNIPLESLPTDLPMKEERHPDTDAFGSLRSLVNYGILPYFDALAVNGAPNAISAARKKLGEFALTLQDMHLRIQAPDLVGTAHPRIILLIESNADHQMDLLVADSTFLNELTLIVLDWIRQIQKCTSPSHFPADGDSISSQVLFWKSMDEALASLSYQIASPEVTKSIEILNKGKRFHVTLGFQNDLRLSEKISQAKAYNSVLKELPITSLSTCPDTDFDAFTACTSLLFEHLKQKFNANTAIPAIRAVAIVDSVLLDVTKKFSAVLSAFSLLSLDRTTFTETVDLIILLGFNRIDMHLKYLSNLFRDLLRKRLDKSAALKFDQDHYLQLKSMLDHVKSVYYSHHDMLDVAQILFADVKVLTQLATAYDEFLVRSCPFEATAQAKSEWRLNEKAYMEIHADLNHQAHKRILQLFENASFCDYVAISKQLSFTTDASPGSWQQFINDTQRLTLLQVAHDEVRHLVELNGSFDLSMRQFISPTCPKDVATANCSIITHLTWSLLIQHKVTFYTSNLCALLGNDWIQYNTAGQLQQDLKRLLSTANPQTIVDSCMPLIEKSLESIADLGKVIYIEKILDTDWDVQVSFDSAILAAADQVRAIMDYGFKVPPKIQMNARRAESLLRVATDLIDAIHLLKNIVSSTPCIDNDLSLQFILNPLQRSVSKGLGGCLEVDWKNLVEDLDLVEIFERLDPVHKTDNSSVLQLHALDRINSLINLVSLLFQLSHRVSFLEDLLLQTIYDLETCPFDADSLLTHISKLGDALNQFEWGGEEENLLVVRGIADSRIAAILGRRCISEIRALQTLVADDQHCDASDTLRTVCSISVYGANMVVMPPVATLKSVCSDRINAILGIATSQSKISARGGGEKFLIPTTSIDVVVCDTLRAVDEQIRNAEQYVAYWGSIIAAWSLDLSLPEDMAKIISPDADLSDWLRLASDLSTVSDVIGNGDSERMFGTLLAVTHSSAKSAAMSKHETLRTSLLSNFCAKLGSEIANLTLEMQSATSPLEYRLSFDTNDSQLIKMLILIINTNKLMLNWQDRISSMKACQTLLFKFNYRLPTTWTYVESLENKFALAEALLKKKTGDVEANMSLVLVALDEEVKRLTRQTETEINEWNKKKPVGADVAPDDALLILNIFSKRFALLSQNHDEITMISSQWNTAKPVESSLEQVSSEIDQLKLVWTSIHLVWQGVRDVETTMWSKTLVKDLRRDIDRLIKDMRRVPLQIRQYDAFESIQSCLNAYSTKLPSLSKLKSQSLGPRHWFLLFEAVGLPETPFDQLQVGQVLKIDFSLHDLAVKSIVQRAEAEMAIASELEKIESEWNLVRFDMFNHKDKCRLIKNWGAIFEKCNNDIGALSSMESSPFFGTFEVEIAELTNRLNKLFVLLDTWVDVQRQWIYLDGIFGSNSGVQLLLPIESSRFVNITFDFFDLLKRLNKSNLVMDVLAVPQAQTGMAKLQDGLIRVKRSLTDYLERQRESFPRFYFVGNEDLLEIIAGPTDVSTINRHFKKMFLGIESVGYDESTSTINSVVSAQGEVVMLAQPINISNASRLDEWLGNLQDGICATLALLTGDAVDDLTRVRQNRSGLDTFCRLFPAQVCTLALRIMCTDDVEKSIAADKLSFYLEDLRMLLSMSTTLVGETEDVLQRTKYEHFIIELIHECDIAAQMVQCQLESVDRLSSYWYMQQKFYICGDNPSEPEKYVQIKHAELSTYYGFEYLGVPEKLAYTPLMEKCFLTMAQALNQRKGGSPFGSAGTGKTESVKALGYSLGKMVMVFCCDESFDYESVERLLTGLCKVGCWGCFDEFNRLEENILSAVSSLIEEIEVALESRQTKLDIAGKLFAVNPQTGIFVTMNPGYAGRVELPDGLKKQFRSFSMEVPDKECIIRVLLSSRAFHHASDLASCISAFFAEFESTVSKQLHYDFGLRTLKAVLDNCGRRKRTTINSPVADIKIEYECVLHSIVESLAPRLLMPDEALLHTLLEKHFPESLYDANANMPFSDIVRAVGVEKGLTTNVGWLKKALQLYEAQVSHAGVMLVGDAGSGKSALWTLVLEAMGKMENRETLHYIIDCKVTTKDEVYGYLDEYTRDWTDGIFTSILRKVRENARGEQSKIVWIIFDGDVDPIWIENLNSVLDDNRILTLPNGERIGLSPNIRLIFETDSLKYATPATVSRCSMIWVDGSFIEHDTLLKERILLMSTQTSLGGESNSIDSGVLQSCKEGFTAYILQVFDRQTLMQLEQLAGSVSHVMHYDTKRCINTLSILLSSYLKRYCDGIIGYPYLLLGFEKYLGKACLLSAIWAFAGDSTLDERGSFGDQVARLDCFAAVDSITDGCHHIDYDISVPDAEWADWRRIIGHVELDTHQLAKPNVIVPTIDTVRHERMIFSLLNERLPIVLCGPPGSGKTMTLLESLRLSSKFDLISLNFSKETSPQALMNSLDQYCVYKKTTTGYELAPRVNGKWIVVFCDEINLPQTDDYGTQTVISLLRQMIEHNGFWAKGKNTWVRLSNIQFVAACNLPNDPGRLPLSNRFLRHGILIMVDYPGLRSLKIIYDAFNGAVMKSVPDMRGYASTITDAMLQIYRRTTESIKPLMQDHYIYSPRELTRWSKGLLQGLRDSKLLTVLQLVRLWYHEGLRLFYDRLVGDWEREWTKTLFKDVIEQFFPNIDSEYVLRDPVLFSNWLSSSYEAVSESHLREFVAERLKVFAEEEIEVNLVLHEGLLDHCLRIDRVLRHPQGHMILAGPCTSGKTTLSKFVAWINGLSVIHLNVYSGYTIDDFDATLRQILMRCVSGERICFIIDESSILKAAFIERMNTLLANAEIPGLFEGEDHANLMQACLKSSHSQGLLLDTDEELTAWFAQTIAATLHVVLNVSQLKSSELRSTVVSSPALFNRCVFNWMGDWSNVTLQGVGNDLASSVPLDLPNFELPQTLNPSPQLGVSSFRDAIIDALVFIYRQSVDYSSLLAWGRVPGNFIESIRAFVSIFRRKSLEADEEQRHTISGLDKLKEAVVEVNRLKADLSHMQKVLAVKDKEARIMLNQMLTEQNEAERKQEFSIETQLELEKQEQEIEARKAVVIRDLQVAEPAVLEAQRGVQNIKKQHLTEIRSMANPPAAVKMTMESVCNLLGFDVSSWRDVQLIVRRDDFIAKIVSFDNKRKLTPELRVFMEKQFISRPEYNFEAVNRASKACGPLLEWVVAQLTYSKILKEVGPLREEVAILESHALKTKAQLIAIDEMIHELEGLIETLKDEYSKLIREAENIKQETDVGKNKIAKSLLLIESLTTEKDRWRSNVQQFGKQREQMIGNAVLAAAYTTYAGAYDQKGRQLLWEACTTKLRSSGIPFDPQLSISSMMLRLLDDNVLTEMCSIRDTTERENLAIIGNCHIPVIVDPSNRALEMLPLLFKPRRVTRTSFSAPGFLKVLENSLRFGGIVIVEEAEKYDPILDGLLRGDVRHEGGRKIVRLGGLEVDYSPQFKLILFTRDSKIQLSPFVESRTRFVDFTVTSGSLEEKALDATLCCIHPEVDKKRSELVRLQGEYQIHMSALEHKLLMSLSDAEGRIVENESILATLGELKAEALAVDVKMLESRDILLTLDQIRDEFKEFGLHAAAIFSALSAIKRLNRFYNFALLRFLGIIDHVLTHRLSDSSRDLITDLYRQTFATAASLLLHDDRVVLAILLADCFYRREIGVHAGDGIKAALECIVTGNTTAKDRILDICLARYNDTEQQSLAQLLERNNDNEAFVKIAPLYDAIPHGDATLAAFELLTRFLYPSQSAYGTMRDLEYWSKQPNVMSSPLLLVSIDGSDAKSTVERLAVKQGHDLFLVSMGSRESTESAIKALRAGADRGSWILIQNVHMSPSWIDWLEQWLNESTFDPGFKLFLTCKHNFDRMPATLLQQCQVISFESMHGLKNAVLGAYNIVARDKLMSKTALFQHVYLLMVVLYSILQERTRYAPVTFTKNHDINDSDFIAGYMVLESVVGDKDFPDTLNWASIRYLIATIAFGAKITDSGDLNYVETLATHFFSRESLLSDYNLVPTKNSQTVLRLPAQPMCDSFHTWLEEISDDQASALLGLPSNAASQFNDQRLLKISSRALKLMN